MPLYYECEDGHLDDASQTTGCSNGLDHEEEEEDSKWDTSLCFLNSEINFPDSIEEHNVIFFETLIGNQALNYDILNENFDISCENG